MPELLYTCADRVKQRITVEDGLTLREMALRLNPERGDFPTPTVAFQGGTPVLRRDGGWEKPVIGGVFIIFVELPMGGGGGGSNPIAAIFAVVAIAVMWWNPGGWVAGAGLLGLAEGTFAYGMTMGLVNGLIVAGIGMLAGAIAGTPKVPQGQIGAMNAAAASPTYNINSSGNQARLYQPEPEGFGRMLIVPDYAAQTWMQYVGNEQYGYFVYALGRGRYHVEALQYGDTVFWRDGHFTSSAYTGETGETYSAAVNAELAAGAGYCAPGVAVAPGTEAQALTFTMSFPDGLCSYVWNPGHYEDKYDSDYGSSRREWVPGAWRVVGHTASVAFQCRALDQSGAPQGDWLTCGSASWTRAAEGAFSESCSIRAPHYARWEVRAANTGVALGPVTGIEPGWYWQPEQTFTTYPRQRMVFAAVSSISVAMAVQIVEPGQPVTLFPDNVITSGEVAGQEFFGPNEAEYSGWVGPYVTNPPGTGTNRILLDIVFPQGLGRYNDQGGLESYGVSWSYEYRAIDDFGNPVSGWAVLTAGSLSLATMTPQRRTLVCNVAEGRFEVRGVRTSASAGDGRTLDTMQWTAMRAMLPGTLTYPQTVVALKIKASNTLSQTASGRFKALLTRKLPLYDLATGTWSAETPTRSWAAAVCAVCKAEWGGQVTDDQLDLETLWEIDARLRARGWHYDAYLDGAYNVWQLLTEMCQAQLCIPRMSGTIFSAVEDRPGRPARYILSPRNIRRGTFKLSWQTWSEQTPDDVTLNYLDSAYGFQQRDVTATLPESESREPASLDVLGIVDRDHAFKVALGYAARNRWRRVTMECEVEGIGRRLIQGDVCSVVHPRFRETASGTLAGWDEAALRLDLKPESGELPAGERYLALTAPDGMAWGPVRLSSLTPDNRAFLDPEDYAALLLQGQSNPWRWLHRGRDGVPTVWTMQAAREFSRRMIVQSVQPIDLWHSSVTLVNDHERVGGYEDLPTPPWRGRGQLPAVESLDAPQALVVKVGGEAGAPVLAASWLSVAGASGYEVESGTDGVSWTRFGRVTVNAVSLPATPGRVWLRVAAVSETLQSGWSVWSGDASVMPPGTPELTVASYAGAGLALQWRAMPEATDYTVNILVEGRVVRSIPALRETAFIYTPGMGKEDGGPWRDVTVHVFGENAAGPGAVTSRALSDPAPAEITGAEVSAGTDAITLTGVSGPGPGDVTGYVILRGTNANFDAEQIAEMRICEGLPYIWTGLAPGGLFYFRIAAKDGFFDAAGGYRALNYSAVMAARTTEAERV